VVRLVAALCKTRDAKARPSPLAPPHSLAPPTTTAPSHRPDCPNTRLACPSHLCVPPPTRLPSLPLAARRYCPCCVPWTRHSRPTARARCARPTTSCSSRCTRRRAAAQPLVLLGLLFLPLPTPYALPSPPSSLLR
jgi:hypothetical protein